jgi:hypothetical protein
VVIRGLCPVTVMARLRLRRWIADGSEDSAWSAIADHAGDDRIEIGAGTDANREIGDVGRRLRGIQAQYDARSAVGHVADAVDDLGIALAIGQPAADRLHGAQGLARIAARLQGQRYLELQAVGLGQEAVGNRTQDRGRPRQQQQHAAQEQGLVREQRFDDAPVAALQVES